MATKFHIDKSISWWVTSPAAQRKKSVGISFSRDLGDFLRHTSLHCYSKLADASYGFWEKIIWFCVHALAASLLIVFLSDAWVGFAQQYFATTLFDPVYPIERVPFPAVTICSNNRLSRQRAAAYAEELSKADPDKRNTTFFMERIKLLGLLYNRDAVTVDNADTYQFQQFLDLYGTGENESYYNSLQKMDMLTPPCHELILKCWLDGQAIDCFQNSTFHRSLTSHGFCCTFNHDNRYRSRDRNNRLSTAEMGLIVSLNTSSADIFYSGLRIDGTLVLLHPPNKFPDVSSGGSQEVFIINGQDNFLSISPYVLDSIDTLRQFSPKTRNCFFDDESPSIYKLLGQLRYSFNNCVSRCRIKSVIILCKCLPFYLPKALAPNGTETVFCTLQHLDCLQRYRFKWASVLSRQVSVLGLERETEDALFCPHCLPSCDDVTYKVSTSNLPVKSIYTDGLSPHDRNDVTVLRVFFAESYVKYYRQIVRNSWYEAFSTIGNYCGILLGISLAIILEFVFFIGRQIILALNQGRQNGVQALTIYP